MSSPSEVALYAVDDLDSERIAAITDLINRAFMRHRSLKPVDRLGPGEYRTESAGREVLVLWEGGAMVATATLHPVERGLWVSLAAVAPERQGGGLGGHLLAQADAIAAARGLESLDLDAIDVFGNVDYYHARGFVEVESRECPVGSWGITVPFRLVRLRRPLRSF